MSTLLIVLLVLLLVGGFGGWHFGSPAIGGSWVLILIVILVILALTGRL